MWLLAGSIAFAAARPVSPVYEGNCQSPAWAPDGLRLSYEVNFHDRKTVELYVVNVTQNVAQQVRPVARGTSDLSSGFTTAATETASVEASWSPKSLNRFVYSASAGNRDFDLYLDKGGAMASAPGADGSPGWSPDGRNIVFTSARTGQGDLYLLDLSQSDAPPRRLTNDADATEIFASWSPDGTALAYVGRSSQGDNISIIENLTSPTPRALTTWTHTATRPRWSPDGRLIAFYANKEKSERFDLYIVAATGGDPQLLIRGVVMNPRGPVWTPDGTRVITVLDDDNRFDPVYAVPISDASRARPLPTGTVGNGDLDVIKAADGRLLLAVAAQGLESDKERDFKRVYVVEISP